MTAGDAASAVLLKGTASHRPRCDLHRDCVRQLQADRRRVGVPQGWLACALAQRRSERHTTHVLRLVRVSAWPNPRIGARALPVACRAAARRGSCSSPSRAGKQPRRLAPLGRRTSSALVPCISPVRWPRRHGSLPRHHPTIDAGRPREHVALPAH